MRVEVAFMALALAACSSKTEPVVDNSATVDLNTTEDLPTVVEEPTDAWTFSDDIDPITDARVLTAGTKATGAANDIEIEVKCFPGQPRIRYEISGFNKDGEGATLPFTVFGTSRFNSSLYRADRRQPVTVMNRDPQYTNQTIIEDAGAGSWIGSNAGSAQQLTVRLQFSNSNETYSLDQTTPNFQRAVNPCLLAQRAVAAKARVDEEARRARSDAERTAYEDSIGDDPFNIAGKYGKPEDEATAANEQ